MASKRELEALIVLAGKIDPSLQKAIRSAEKSTKALHGETSTMGRVASKAFGIMTTAATVGAAAIGVAMVATAKKGIELASDLTEVQNVVDVTFGKNAKQINDWSQSALKAYGLSELSAKRYSSVLGAMMKSSGISSKYLVSMSENLTALSGDFASFYNLDPAEAFEKIKAGISGETEPLKALGINMTVANLQAYALAHGIKTAYAKMSQADQTILRYNYLLEASKDAQGDFMRTQDSYANQQRLLKEGFGQLAAKIMSKALPALTSLLQKGNQLIDSFANSPDKIAKFQNIIGNVVDKVVAAIPTAINFAENFAEVLGQVFNAAADVFHFMNDNWAVIEPMIVGIVAAMVAWKAITLGMAAYTGIMAAIRGTTVAATAAQWGMNAAVLANPMTWIVLAIAAAVGVLVAGIYLLWKNWEQVSNWIVGIWQNNVMPFFQSLGGWFSGIWDGVIAGFKAYLNFYIKGINMIISGLNKVHFSIPKVLGGGEFGVNIPLLPTFAKGGFATGPSIFGEAGPEAAIPLKRSPRSLGLLNKTAQMLGVGGTGSPQFVFAPVIGGGGGGSMMDDLKAAGDDFFQRADQWWESKRRESFAG